MKNTLKNKTLYKKHISFLALCLCSSFWLMESPCFSMDDENGQGQNGGGVRRIREDEGLDPNQRPAQRRRLGETDQAQINEELRGWLNQNFRNDAGEFLKAVDREATKPTYAREVRENLERIYNNANFVVQGRSNLLQAISPLQEGYDEANNVLTINGGFIGISDIEAALKNRKPSIINITSTFLLFDQDLNCQGTSRCNFKADYWKVLGARTLDLSGVSGLDGEDGNEQEIDGQPGKPGGNGGKFVGSIPKYEKMDNLTINIKGGSGGKGGNGAAGINGIDGVNADPNALHSFILSGQGAPYQHNIGWQGVKIHVPLVGEIDVKCDYTLNGTRVLYQNPGTPGTVGGNGGNAGRGGISGNTGSINWKANNFEFLYVGPNGVNGKDGNPGVGGRGGKHGYHSKRHKLTNMTCTAVAGGPFDGATGTNAVPDMWEPADFVARGYAASGMPGILSVALPQNPPQPE